MKRASVFPLQQAADESVCPVKRSPHTKPLPEFESTETRSWAARHLPADVGTNAISSWLLPTDLGSNISHSETTCSTNISNVPTASLPKLTDTSTATFGSPCPAVRNTSRSDQLLRIEAELSQTLEAFDLVQGQISCYYNPLVYAKKPHEIYLTRYCDSEKKVMFLGMNPGPYGMAQTGVPFGSVSVVRGWLGIEEQVGKPVYEHPARPIHGFQCKREETSGTRFWNLIRDLCTTPETFAKYCLVYNYCPLIFMSKTGKNISIADIPKQLRTFVYECCDHYLKEVLRLYKVKYVIGVGRFAERRAIEAQKLMEIDVFSIMHPSPLNPAANRGWAEKVKEQLEENGMLGVICGESSISADRILQEKVPD